MLAYNRIKFLNLHFFRHVLFVFGRRVVVACASCRNQFDFVSHGVCSLDFFATGAYVFEYCIDAFLIDDAHAVGGYAQLHKPLLTFDPKTVTVQIRHEPASGFVVSMGHIVSGHRAFAGDLAYSRHDKTPIIYAPLGVLTQKTADSS